MTRHSLSAPFIQTAIAAVLTASAAGAILAPAMAQTPVRDFTLPPGETPTPAPVPAQGPVDDTGVVPVAPRPIDTNTPEPIPSPTPSEATPTPPPTPTSGAVVQPLPQQSTQRTAELSPPQTQAPDQNPIVAPTITPSPQATPTSPQASPTPGVGTDFSTSQVAGSAKESDALSDNWLWIVGGLAALLALLAGAMFFLRRKAASASVPTIERPIVGKNAGQSNAAEKGRFVLDLKVTSVVRSVMMVTVKATITVANRSDRALRDLTITGDLISASKSIAMDQQIAREGTNLPPLITLERIGPNKTQTTEVTLQLPTGQIDGFRQGNIPMFVPLARICADCEAADAQIKTFVLGVEAAGSKLHPLPLNGMPGEYQGVGSRPVA